MKSQLLSCIHSGHRWTFGVEGGSTTGREWRVVGFLLRIICSIIVHARFPFGCLDIAADTQELIVHVVPVVGSVDVQLCIGEVPFLCDGLDDNVFLLFLNWVECLVFFKVGVVAVHACWCGYRGYPICCWEREGVVVFGSGVCLFEKCV